jgi:hypothetical protein
VRHKLQGDGFAIALKEYPEYYLGSVFRASSTARMTTSSRWPKNFELCLFDFGDVPVIAIIYNLNQHI